MNIVRIKAFFKVLITFSIIIMAVTTFNLALNKTNTSNTHEYSDDFYEDNLEGMNTQVEFPSGFDLLGNRILNSNLRYSKSNSTIPNWKIFATNNIYGGIGDEKTMTTLESGGLRYISDFSPNYYFRFKSSNETGNFYGMSAGPKGDESFYLLSQTVDLVQGKKYYYRAELSGSGGEVKAAMMIYPGTDVIAGSNAIYSQTAQLNNSKKIYEIPFVATESKVTLSIRHIRDTNDRARLNIYRVGFYLEDDYLLQVKLNNLFETLNLTNLKFDEIQNINRKISEIETEITANQSLYTKDVVDYVRAGLITAKNQRDQFQAIYTEISSFYEADGSLKPNVTTE